MISRDTFTAGMSILADRFGRVLAAPTTAAYYEQLAVLSDAEFTAAVKIAINETFLPGPQQIVEMVRPKANHKVCAEELWGDVLSAIRRTPWRMIQRAAFQDHEWKTIATVGGLEAIANMSDTAEPHMHRRFLEAYVERAVAAGNQQRAIAPLETMDGQVQQIVRDTAKRLGGGR
jgi:hypothetical protein